MKLDELIGKTEITAYVDVYPFRVQLTGRLSRVPKDYVSGTHMIVADNGNDLVFDEDWVTSMSVARGTDRGMVSIDTDRLLEGRSR